MEEALPLIRLAEERRVVLTVFQNRRWDSDFLTLQQLLASGRLGDVALLQMRYGTLLPTERKPGMMYSALGFVCLLPPCLCFEGFSNIVSVCVCVCTLLLL